VAASNDNLPTPQRARRNSEGLRLYVIGDVHGRADLLEEMFRRIDRDIADTERVRTTEIFLGDYVDRGPNSRRVIDALIARGAQRQAIFLKGNHEALMLQFLREPDTLPEWLRGGAAATLASYGIAPTAHPSPKQARDVAVALRGSIPEGHSRFLLNLKPFHSCGDYFFVHAGVRPGVPLSRQREDDLLWIRSPFLEHAEDYGRMIVHGHTPVTQPEFRANRINIDTGAFATGRLTCLVIEDERCRVLD
jgi:serine/threonine protein phosphatase 1